VPHLTAPDAPRCRACGWYLLGDSCRRCEALGAPPAIKDEAGPLASSEAETAVETAAAGLGKPSGDPGPSDPEPPTPVTLHYRPQLHGGALLSGGKPGNRGGGRKPGQTVDRIRELIAEYGVDLVEQVLRGDPIDPHVTRTGEVVLTTPTLQVRLFTLAECLRIAHGHAAARPPANEKRRELHVVWRDEAKRGVADSGA
jgi:hypothetical protein